MIKRWVLLAILAAPSLSLAQDAADVDFFEKKVRPLLVERCYKCHSATSEKLKGGLRLDTRAAALKGGDGGPALVPGKPEKSLLIEAVTYKNVDLRLTKAVTLRRGGAQQHRVELVAQLLNAFNRGSNYNIPTNNIQSTIFGQSTTLLPNINAPSRQVELAVRYQF